MKPLVSIVVPVYNVEPYIRKCIDTLINQTLKDIEIILVDDGSTDSSGLICDEYKETDERILVIHKNNEGLGLARNTGIEAATGEYIGFVDSDDFVRPDMFEYLYSNVKKYDADISYCEKIKWFSDTQKEEGKEKESIRIYEYNELSKYLLDRIGTLPEEKEDNSYSTAVWLGIFRHEIFTRNNISFVSERVFISEDIIFNIDFISKCKRIVHSNRLLYYYRCTQNSLTTKYKEDRFEKNVVLYREIIRRLKKVCPDVNIEYAACRYLLTYARIACMQEVQFKKLNGKKKAIKKIGDISNNDELEAVLEKYPINKLPMIKGLFCYLLKHHRSKAIYYLIEWKMKI